MKDKSVLINAGIDYDDGIDRFSGISQLYEKYLKLFLEDEEYSKLCIAMENNNTDDAFRAAHTLKGVTGNLSIKKLYESTKPFVELLRNGKIDDAQKLFPPIKKEYEKSTNAIIKYFE